MMLQSIRNLATTIVKRWREKSPVNIIIVAPPASRPEKLFNLLSDREFINSIIQEDISTLALAKIEGSHFRSQDAFVNELSRQWNVPAVDGLEATLQLRYLTQEVKKTSSFTPVLLIPRFHEAMERLGEEFGAALRDLDMASELTTVVELPVNRRMLKARWEADPKKGLFLNSNWGQGHEAILLTGYTQDEVYKLVKDKDGTKEAASFLFEVTKGLPLLVDNLVSRCGSMPLESYELLVQSRANQLCEGLLDWLDIPGTYTYTRLVAQSLFQSDPAFGPTSLKDHPWETILKREDGKAGCRLLAWACIWRLSTSSDIRYLNTLIEIVRKRRFSDAVPQLAVLSNKENTNWEKWKALELLCRIAETTNPFALELWGQSDRHIKALAELARKTKINEIQLVNQRITQSQILFDLITGFLKARKSEHCSMLEQYVCEGPSDSKTIGYLNLLKLRLRSANEESIPYLAQKAVLELPESLVQVFCSLKYKVSIWCHPGFSSEEVTKICELTKRPYSSKKPGSVLSFYDMLCLDLLQQDKFPAQLRLVDDAEELLRLNQLNNTFRNSLAHGITVLTKADWNEYFNHCAVLIDRAKKSLFGEADYVELADIVEYFSPILQSFEETRNTR